MQRMFKTEDIQLRAPSELEFLELAQFSYDNFVEETAQSSGESIDSLKTKFGMPPSRRTENDVWLIIEASSQRVGFIWFQIIPQENLAFGWDIYLEPKYRSKGVGRHVMRKCSDELSSRGIRKAKICVFEHNEIARILYSSLGFEVEKFDRERKQFTLVLDLAQ